MKIVQTKEDTALIECSYSELHKMTGLWKEDFKRACFDNKSINIGKWAENFSRSEDIEVKNAIDALKGATKFLESKYSCLQDRNKLKG